MNADTVYHRAPLCAEVERMTLISRARMASGLRRALYRDATGRVIEWRWYERREAEPAEVEA